MKPLYLPEGATHVQYSVLAHRIADALWPSAGPTDKRIAYGAARLNLDAELAKAVEAGALELKDPVTLGSHPFPFGNAMQSALVTVEALGAFIAPRGLAIEYARPNPNVVEADETPDIPEFTMPVRMFEVDPLLLTLPPNAKVRYVSDLGARGLGNAGDFVEESRSNIARQAEGFFTVAEAARILAESPAGGDARGWREKMHAASHAGDLFIRDTTRTKKAPKAIPNDFTDLVKESDLTAWLEKDGAGYTFPKAPEATIQQAPTSAATDFAKVATRQQLIEAFGSLTGMALSWFAKLDDTPKLKAARRLVGQGGRGHVTEPYFCPYQVLQWLLDPKRKKGRRLSTDEAKGRAWGQLEKCFPTVYREFSIGDPRPD